MPGELKPDAVCPKCGESLAVLIDTTNAEGVEREYIHAKAGPKVRRKRRCLRWFTDHDKAHAERKGLEV